jgi:hypothetical protein
VKARLLFDNQHKHGSRAVDNLLSFIIDLLADIHLIVNLLITQLYKGSLRQIYMHTQDDIGNPVYVYHIVHGSKEYSKLFA